MGILLSIYLFIYLFIFVGGFDKYNVLSSLLIS